MATPSPYITPFNVATYRYRPCYIFTPQPVGIYLSSIGSGTTPYQGIIIGDSIQGDANLFDTLSYGIRAVNANVTVHNSLFTRTAKQNYPSGAWSQDYGGVGIYASATDGTRYSLSVQPATNIAGGYVVSDSFYDCRMAVSALNYMNVRGDSCYMVSSQNYSGGINNGDYGYNFQDKYYDSIIIHGNTIINITNGVAFKCAASVSRLLSGYPGQLEINSNYIDAVVPGGTLTDQFLDKAIWVDNTINFEHLSSYGLASSQMLVKNNTINNAFNGIYVNGIGAQQSLTNGNRINLLNYSVPNRLQYGIYHAQCSYDHATYNIISGNDYGNDSMRGVLIWGSSLHAVGCSQFKNLGRGVEMNGTTVTSTFDDNEFTNCGKGFVLGGVIGEQGSPRIAIGVHWLATGSFAWGPDHPQTYTQYRALPASSPLHVYPDSTSDPIYNSSENYFAPSINCESTYGCDISSLMITGSGNGLSPFTPPGFPSFPDCSFEDYGVYIPQLEQLAQQYITKPWPNLTYWMSQHAIWELMAQNDTLGDMSAILTAFKNMAPNSRFAMLAQIEDFLANADVTDAQAMLDGYGLDSLYNTQIDSATNVKMADDTTADVVVQNYRTYYQIYINYETSNMTATDSAMIAALAYLCPITNGGAVFKARALYDVLYDTLTIFPNNCPNGSDPIDSQAQRQSKSSGVKQLTIKQQYSLYPNPNDGNFEIKQATVDDAPVVVEIWDAVGQSVYKNTMKFNNSTSALNIRNVVSGLYLIQITDSKGSIFRFKFVVE